MTTKPDPILKLVAQMERARREGTTEDEAAEIALVTDVMVKMDEIASVLHKSNGGTLDSNQFVAFILTFAAQRIAQQIKPDALSIVVGLALCTNDFTKILAQALSERKL